MNLWDEYIDDTRLSDGIGLQEGAATGEVSAALRPLLADLFLLYVKTKNFYWHMSMRHLRDYRLLLDEYWGQIFAMTETIAERAHNIGESGIRPGVDAARFGSNGSNEALHQLRVNSQQLARFLRSARAVCNAQSDAATASVLERWIDETERRTWLLSETMPDMPNDGPGSATAESH